MGLFNTFRALNQPGVAEKQFKFQMKVMHDAASSGGFTDTQHVEVLEGGACTGCTMLWLREQWKADGAFAFARDGKYTGRLGTEGGGVGMLGVRLQTLFEQNAKSPEAVTMALKAIGRAVGLELEVKNSWEDDNLYKTLRVISESTEAGTYYVELYMKKGTKEMSHALGVNATRDGSFFVFDANCGEYLVQNATLFGMELEEAYEAHLGSTVEACVVTKVVGR